MLRVAITGGIGSGKSTVCRLFAMLGIPVYDSDARAKELMVSDPAVAEGVKAIFGPQSFLGDGTLDRAFIAKKAFADKELLDRLNAVVHPAVLRDFEAFANRGNCNFPYILLESAILFDAGFDRFVDRTIWVEAPAQVRLGRVVQRDGVSSENVARRMANQSTTTPTTDFTVNNDGETLLWPQVLAIDKTLRV